MFIQKKAPFLIILFIISLLVYGVYLLYYLKKFPDRGTSQVTDLLQRPSPDVPEGNAVLTLSSEQSGLPFKHFDINMLYVKDFQVSNFGEDNVPQLDLELIFKDNNFDKTLKVTLLGEVFYSEFTKRKVLTIIVH